ncbi:MAG: hypothetical protein AYK22_04645 [Thermoplasmatales archaeon SG8-52-3]|nr:MAG: hypothetical protein AYK22_04645 [Thermoplasmatales archaeon SG8-52-3]
MKKFNFQLCIIVLIIFFIYFSSIAIGFYEKIDKKLILKNDDDFYFVHLTDTHIRHKLFDKNENTRNILSSVVNHVISFDKKPAFIVITGDLTEWGGNMFTGALNCIAFANCFYELDGQLYADENFSIPVYTTPGNHEYMITQSLKNYHKFIDKKHADENDRYVISYENLSLFFMNSGPNYFLNPLTLIDVCGVGLYNCDIEWLEDNLKNTTQKKVVLMHHPAVNKPNKYGFIGGVFIKNRENFINLCDNYNAELVLAGHTHHAVIYDKNQTLLDEFPLNCSLYPTLYVQSDDCKRAIHYRNISIIGDDIWVEESVELSLDMFDLKNAKNNEYIFSDIQKYILSFNDR